MTASAAPRLAYWRAAEKDSRLLVSEPSCQRRDASRLCAAEQIVALVRLDRLVFVVALGVLERRTRLELRIASTGPLGLGAHRASMP